MLMKQMSCYVKTAKGFFFGKGKGSYGGACCNNEEDAWAAEFAVGFEEAY